MMALEFRRLIYTSGFLSCYWLLYLFYSTVPIYSYTMLHHYPVLTDLYNQSINQFLFAKTWENNTCN